MEFYVFLTKWTLTRGPSRAFFRDLDPFFVAWRNLQIEISAGKKMNEPQKLIVETKTDRIICLEDERLKIMRVCQDVV